MKKTLLIWRVIIYLVTASCLFYLTNVLQNVFHDLLLRVGMTDVITLGGLLDQISGLPIFTSLQATIAVFIVGMFFWWLIWRDRRKNYDGGSNAVRAFFLALITAAFGLRILLSAILIVRNVDTFGESSLPIAASLAAVGAWGIALLLVLLEWTRGEQFDDLGLKFAMLFAYLGQWILVIMGVWAIAQTVQSLLQTLIHPLPLCSRQLDVFAQLIAFIARIEQACTDTPPLAGATLTMLLIVLAFAIYARWGTREGYKSDRIRDADAIIGATIAGVVVTLNSVLGIRLAADIVTGHSETVFPESILSTPGTIGVASYPFVGPLIAGFCVFGFYVVREYRRSDAIGRSFGLMALSFPVGIVFLVGACLLAGHILTALLYRAGFVEIGVTPDNWSDGLMFFIPGLGWGGLLWSRLRGLGRPKVVRAPNWIYVMVFLILTGGAMLVSLAFFIALVGSELLGSPIDPTNHFWPYMIATTVVTFLPARYYNGLMRRQQTLRS